MNKMLMLICISFVGSSLIAQQEQYQDEIFQNEDNLQRYNLDYELIDYTFVNGDSSVLNELDITSNFHARLLNDDVVITFITNNIKMLLYSENRMRAARGLPIQDTSTKLNEQ